MKNFKSIKEKNIAFLNKEFNKQDLISCYTQNNSKNVEFFSNSIEKAKLIDEKLEKGCDLGKLAGCCFLVEDNILVEGENCNAGLEIIDNFKSIYTATAIKKLIDEDAIILGKIKTNVNQTEVGLVNEIKDGCLNINNTNDDYSLLNDFCDGIICSDVNSSIFAKSNSNFVSLRAPYGSISRFGVISRVPSFETISFLTKNYLDALDLYNICKGKDKFDLISRNFVENEIADFNNIKIACVKNCINDKLKNKFNNFAEISLNNITLLKDIYSVITLPETSSNLARFDGIKYGKLAENCNNIEEVYTKTRTEFFSENLKQEIMYGDYFLSGGKRGEVYYNAKLLIDELTSQIKDTLNKYNFLLIPNNDDYKLLPALIGYPAVNIENDFILLSKCEAVNSLCKVSNEITNITKEGQNA